MRYRICPSISYRDWFFTELTEMSDTGMKVCTGSSGVPVSLSYPTYCRTELTDVSGDGLNVSNIPTCPVMELMSYRTIRRVRYRSCWRYMPAARLGTYRTEHTLYNFLAFRWIWFLYGWKYFLFCFWLRLDPLPREYFHDHRAAVELACDTCV